MERRVSAWVFAAATLAAFSAACERDDDASRAAAQRAAATPPPAQFPVVAREHLIGEAAGENWLLNGGAYNNQRFSTLDQISRTNVHELVLAWVYSSGIHEGFDTTPIVAGNTMYITTPESHVVALNAATGQRLWEYRPQLRPVPVCCGPSNRGVAIWGDKVYVATLDARVVALHNRTGRVVWETSVVDTAGVGSGYSISMAPLAYDGRVFVGVAGGKFGIRGFVAAYDADSGEQIWRWHTIAAPDERGGWWGEYRDIDPFGTPLRRDIAAERENAPAHPNSWQVGGGSVWMTPAYDPASGTLFFSVGGPAPSLSSGVRPGDNLYSGSIVALDAAEGTLRWHFQYLPHDRWDLSPWSPPFLFEEGGRLLVGHAGKTGWLYIVDADSGEPVLRSDNFVPQENLFSPPTSEGVRMAPGANGGTGWSPVTYSPRTRLAYVLGMHQPMVFRSDYQPRSRGELWLGGSFHFVPGEEHWGTFSAIDTRTGEIRWQQRVPEPMLGAALATAGDLVFVGQGSGTFDAFDANTGELLWQFTSTAGVHGGPVSYAVDGVQYVAVAAGGSAHLDTPRGDNLYVFALRDHRPSYLRNEYGLAQYARGGPLRPGAVRQLATAREAGADTLPPPGPVVPPPSPPPAATPAPQPTPPAEAAPQPPVAERPAPERPEPDTQPRRRPRILGEPVDNDGRR